MIKAPDPNPPTQLDDQTDAIHPASIAPLDRETAELGVLALQVWLSPSFPVGSFAFSHGIEWAVQAGDVIDVSTTAAWIGTLLDAGSLRNDVILASCAWCAVAARDTKSLQAVAELALAMAGSSERFIETTAQGSAFASAIRAAWPIDTANVAYQALPKNIAYPIAVAIAAQTHGIARRLMLEMFSVALVQNLVSATIRLSVLGHSDGQRVLALLLPLARNLAQRALDETLDGVGGCAFRSDIAAMKHETQYTRLFRT